MKPWMEYADPSNWHDAANIFPLMPDDEIQKLADDIKANGLKNPVVLLNDLVIDGRNRLLACKLVDIRPNIESRNPEKLGSPTTWVLSQNLHRRQLTTTQRAFVAVEAEKLFAVELAEKERIRKTAAEKERIREIQSTEVKIPQSTKPDARAPQARDQAAKALAVSPRYVQDAKAIATKAPEVAAQAIAGKFTMAEAKKIQQLKPVNPKLYEAIMTGKVTPRAAPKPKPTKPAKKDLRARYSEKDFWDLTRKMMAGTLLNHPRLDELLVIKKEDWTNEAEEGFRRLIKSLDEVGERAHTYAQGLNKLLKTYGKQRKSA